jgi:clan AA aspartic protease
MITGQVTADREAEVRLTIRGPHGAELEIDTIVDTGFTGSLTLPLALITTLGLVYQHATPAILADGSIVMCDAFEATVLWEGQGRQVLVHEASGDVLLGMSLLYGSRMTLDIVDGGTVTIEPLP